ncbi:MAG: chorismate synthase [Candidatus Bathyarchaeales archaeon]
MLASNSIGKEFAVTFFGESHGKCVGTVVDGCPAGLLLTKQDIQKEVDKRIPPKPEIVSERIEKDVVEILSGVFEGYTTGAPICVLVWNKEAIPSDYNTIKDLPRPGHADYVARVKYGGFNDYRGGGRFSGRITVAFIMAGAIAKKLLATLGVEVLAYTTAIGDVKLDRAPAIDEIRRNTYRNAVRCPDSKCAKAMEEAILKAKNEGDSLGGIVECTALNVPVGVGEPIFDSLDADIAKILFTVPAVKGVEFGAGFRAADLKGSENNDLYVIDKGRVATLTNNAGGILGGLSNGMPITVRVAIKPTPSIRKEQKTVDLSKMEETTIQIKGRHDPCVVPKAVPVIESAVAIVLADHMIRGGFIPKVLGRQK